MPTAKGGATSRRTIVDPAGPQVSGGEPVHSASAGLEEVIGWRVRSRAHEVGLSSAELAKRVGLSRAMISKIENGRCRPAWPPSRLAEALDVPITSLFQGLDEERDALYTKAGSGPELGRPGTRSGHRYQLLGSIRGPAKRMEPMLVTLKSQSEVFPLYQHPGTEFLHMIEGEMDYGYAGASYRLRPGDSLQFDGEVAARSAASRAHAGPLPVRHRLRSTPDLSLVAGRVRVAQTSGSRPLLNPVLEEARKAR